MEITGTVVQILPVESGTSKAGKEWKKGGVVIETDGQYPKKVMLTLFGKALDNVHVEQGGKYTFSVDLSSRDYMNPTTGKVSWFTEASTYRAEQAVTPAPAPLTPPSALDSLGIKPQPAPQTLPAEETNDLPF